MLKNLMDYNSPQNEWLRAHQTHGYVFAAGVAVATVATIAVFARKIND